VTQVNYPKVGTRQFHRTLEKYLKAQSPGCSLFSALYLLW
jgi:hypothetical protein